MMNHKHNEIIVQEIKYWKEHKLVPKDTCDFLLVLYTQGEEERIGASRLWQNKIQGSAYLLMLLCVIPLSFAITYFTEFHKILQIALFLLFISFSFWSYGVFKRTIDSYQYIPMITGLIMILYTSVYIIKIGTESLFIIKCVIFMNFITWLWIGWKTKATYVLVMGILAVLFLFVFTIF